MYNCTYYLGSVKLNTVSPRRFHIYKKITKTFNVIHITYFSILFFIRKKYCNNKYRISYLVKNQIKGFKIYFLS